MEAGSSREGDAWSAGRGRWRALEQFEIDGRTDAGRSKERGADEQEWRRMFCKLEILTIIRVQAFK